MGSVVGVITYLNSNYVSAKDFAQHDITSTQTMVKIQIQQSEQAIEEIEREIDKGTADAGDLERKEMHEKQLRFLFKTWESLEENKRK
ncbi:MAG: hypothetical protein GTN99_02955 [Candidatus Dadabacteria bacterium]|nr:hypothetical protein [Candidatus Dadabacteria bacterium]